MKSLRAPSQDDQEFVLSSEWQRQAASAKIGLGRLEGNLAAAKDTINGFLSVIE